jgi:uncharacterized protein (TIGR00251 family)
MLDVREQNGEVVFSVRVQPRASRDAVGGIWQGALRVRLTAPPVEGEANDALVRFLAERLNVPRSAVRLLAGQRSRTKRVAVRGTTVAHLQALAASRSQ